MKKYVLVLSALLLLLTAALIVSPTPAFAGLSIQESEEEDVDLATASARADLVQDGRAVVSARGNHFVVDSVPPLGGGNEERNPLDLLLASLSTCGLFVYEAAAAEMDIPLDSIAVTVEADFAPKGLVDGSVNPRVHVFRALVEMEGPSEEEAAVMADEWRARCPIYTTLERAAPIDIIHVGMDDLGAVLEVDFAYSFEDAAELEAEVGPMAEIYAELPGLRWKIWIINEDAKRFGAVYLFEDAAARAAYLESELAASVAAHPALSDPHVVTYDVMGDESLVTRAPVTSMFANSGDGIGAMLQVDFDYSVPTEEYIAAVSPMAEQFAAVDGLRWKTWILNEDEQRAGAVYFFESPEARAAYLESELAAGVAAHPALSDFRVVPFDVLSEPSMATHAPIGMVSE